MSSKHQVATPVVEDAQSIIDFSPEEEKQVRRATDFKLLSIIIFVFIFLQFDRTNIGNALTGGFKTKVGLTTQMVNTGQTLFTLGIVLFELPSNVVAKRVGANRWIPLLMLCWGAVTISQAFLKNHKEFYATRFLLAAFESGGIPGMAYLVSLFYKQQELGLRFAIFWSSNNIAGIFSGLVALGLLSLNGKGGLLGFQYLFIIEGALTCALAIFAFFALPFAPAQSRRGRGFFTKREMEVVAARTLQDDPAKASSGAPAVTLKDIIDTFKTWQIYGHCASAFLSSVMITPMNTYAPSLVKSLGFAGYSANGLQAPGSALALIVSVLLAWNSDRTRERGFHVATAMLLSGVGALWLALPAIGVSRGVLYAGVVLTQGGMGTGQGVNAAWMISRLEERKRPVALAAYVMSIQLAGFAGSNVFKASDAPRYRKGLGVCAACVLSAALIVVGLKFVYRYIDSKEEKTSTFKDAESIADSTEKN
ncbi:MFS general substrate transporter [Meredithblackwellia eburnea MCA 4105]